MQRKPINLQYLNFDHALCSALSADFGISSHLQFRPILLDGDYCTLMDVRSQTSRKMIIRSGGRDLFLKQLPWYCSAEQALFAIQCQDTARHAGCPIPPTLETRDGARVFRYGGADFTLTEHVHGSRYTHQESQFVSASRELGLLHASIQGDIEGPTPDAFEDAREHVELALSLAEERGDSAAPAALRRLGAWLADEYRKMDRIAWAAVPRGLVHGDYSPWNLIFSGSQDKVVGIVDFDNAHVGPVIRDLAEMLITFTCIEYRADSTNFAPDLPTLPRPGIKVAIESYDNARGLRPAEFAVLPAIGAAVAVELVALGYVRGDFSSYTLKSATSWADMVVRKINDAATIVALERTGLHERREEKEHV